MSKRKFDFECIYYTTQLINDLADEGFFLERVIDPDKLRYIALQLCQNNYDIYGYPMLGGMQIQRALERAHKLTTDSTVQDMLKEGLVEYDSMTSSGEYVLRLTELGTKSQEFNKVAYQKIKEIIDGITHEIGEESEMTEN
jgi:hypothetical protein